MFQKRPDPGDSVGISREDAAVSKAAALPLFRSYAAVRQLGRTIKAILRQFYLRRHVAIRVRGTPCVRENRFSGTRGQIGGGGASAGGRGQPLQRRRPSIPPPPFLVIPYLFVEQLTVSTLSA